MHIAILILCHNNPSKINRLISALNDQDLDIYIHVDKKSNIVPEIEYHNERVFILPDYYRVNVEWAKFSQVEAELNLLKYAKGITDYDYYILLSGSDYPIEPIENLKVFLNINSDVVYLNLYNSKNFNNNGKPNNHDKCNDIYYPDWLLKRYGVNRIIRRIWVAITGGYNYTFRVFRRKNHNLFNSFFGSQWWCLPGETVDWMIKYIDRDPEYINFFRKCSTPDESFFHTLIMNSKEAEKRSDYIHYIDWSENMNSPKNLTIADYDKIMASGKFFARKIQDEQLMDRIDRDLLKVKTTEI